MSKNTIEFEDLKRKEVRKTIENGDKNILIYNPSPSQKQEILNFISENIKDAEINITSTQLLTKIVPILTNINIPKNMAKKKIESVLNDPDDILVEVMDEIKEIINSLANRTLKTIKEMKELPKEELEKIINTYNEKEGLITEENIEKE